MIGICCQLVTFVITKMMFFVDVCSDINHINVSPSSLSYFVCPRYSRANEVKEWIQLSCSHLDEVSLMETEVWFMFCRGTRIPTDLTSCTLESLDLSFRTCWCRNLEPPGVHRTFSTTCKKFQNGNAGKNSRVRTFHMLEQGHIIDPDSQQAPIL